MPPMLATGAVNNGQTRSPFFAKQGIVGIDDVLENWARAKQVTGDRRCRSLQMASRSNGPEKVKQVQS